MNWKQNVLTAAALCFACACDEAEKPTGVDSAAGADGAVSDVEAEFDVALDAEQDAELDVVLDTSPDSKPPKEVWQPPTLPPAPDGVGYCCPLFNEGCGQTHMGGWSPTETGHGYCGWWWDMRFDGLKPYIGQHGCPTMPEPWQSCMVGSDVASPWQGDDIAPDVPLDVSATVDIPDAGTTTE